MSTKETRDSDERPAAQNTRRPRFLRNHGRAVIVSAAAFTVAAGIGVSLLVSGGPAGAATINNGIPAGFPSSSNSGVPSGTPMKSVPGQVSSGPGWSWNSSGGYIEVTGNGATLSGLSVKGNVNVQANNVTINDMKITLGGQNAVGVSLSHTSNATVENSTITGLNTGSGRLYAGVKDTYGDATGTVVKANNISKASTGVQVYEGTIQDNYIHGLGMVSTDHVNGLTTNGDTDPLLIQHNTILNYYGQTDAIGLFQDFDVVSNVTVNDNFLAGGGYSLYGGMGGQGKSSNIKVTNNIFSTMYFVQGGAYGPVTAFDSSASGNVWSGNVWSGTGKTLSSP
jgi:hypothetical protein